MWLKKLLNLAIILLLTQLFFVSGEDLKRCLGKFCGRVFPVSNGNSSVTNLCGACPRGFRTDGFICRKCYLEPSFYDWLFLGFMALLAPFLNCHFIEYMDEMDSRKYLLHISVFIEFLIGCSISVLLMEPAGERTLNFCGVYSIEDWYTIFFNPQTYFQSPIKCTQEAVYPLYTIVLLFYVLQLLLLVAVRLPVYRFFLSKNKLKRRSLYATLYILPILAVIHTVFAGVLYYTFPYILLIVSSLGTAVYLSLKVWTKLKCGQAIFILLMYALANGYGIIAITQLKFLVRDGPLLLVVFLPSTFYLLTHKLTSPDNFYEH